MKSSRQLDKAAATFGKGKRLVGAMACGMVDPDVRDYIHSAGFFVLELTGENVSLVQPEVEFTPREW